MSARSIAITKLLSISSLTDLVGTRIWPSAAQQDALKPYVLVHKPSRENRQLVVGDAGYPRARISIEIVADTAGAADFVGDVVFNNLKNVTNETIVAGNESPSQTFTVTIIPSDFDTDDASDARDAFRRIIDFYVDYR